MNRQELQSLTMSILQEYGADTTKVLLLLFVRLDRRWMGQAPYRSFTNAGQL